MSRLHLMSHALCPYVQRAVISLSEKGVAFDRTDIDLSNKPDWFLAISPLGKTPVLVTDGVPLFESAAILEYLEETQPNPMHPTCQLERARHRAWIEFGSAMLNDIAGFYSARDPAAFEAKRAALAEKADRLEAVLDQSPWFSGDQFSLVDVVFGPVFRYFDTFDEIGDFGILTGRPRLAAWRVRLTARRSVRDAVGKDYHKRLRAFLVRRDGRLAHQIRGQRPAPTHSFLANTPME